MVDRRDQLQEKLDEIAKGWVVVKPVRGDINHLCKFQKLDELKEAVANIPQKWFDDGEDDQIERAVRAALSNAVVRS